MNLCKPQSMMGMNVFVIDESFAARVPIKLHKRARWDKYGKYHARIQKKWNKRFGTKISEVCFTDKRVLYMTPGMYNKLDKLIREQASLPNRYGNMFPLCEEHSASYSGTTAVANSPSLTLSRVSLEETMEKFKHLMPPPDQRTYLIDILGETPWQF